MRETCPLCDHGRSRVGWLGATVHDGVRYTYRECLGCGSLFCDPMPSPGALDKLYDTHYFEDDAEAPAPVDAWLAARLHDVPRATVVDHGCGDGALLRALRARGFHAVGVELRADVAHDVARRSNVEVYVATDDLRHLAADVLHLGDVLEHLPNPLRTLRTAMTCLRDGGIVLARGPLENNASLFTWVLALVRRLRGCPATTHPPHHLTLATRRGMEALFARAGLETVDLQVVETDWPAPSRLDAGVLRNPRALGLWALRRLSRLVAWFAPTRLGNRYAWCGRKPSRP